MKIIIPVEVDVDIESIYTLCKPANKTACLKEIRRYVQHLIDRRANDDSGYWSYPSGSVLAEHLIASGLATKI